MKKVVYISSSLFPSTKANSVQVIKMCEELGKSFNLTLYGIDNRQGLNSDFNVFDHFGCEENLNIILSKKKRAIFYSFSIFFKLFFQENYIYYSRNFLVACLLTFIGKKNVVFEAHVDPKHQPFYNKIFTPFLKFSNIKIVAISQKLKEIFSDYYNFSLDKILVAHDAADEKKFQMERNIILEGNRIQVGYIGSLYKGRGLELVCELAKMNTNIDFNIVGGTEKEISELKISYGYSNVIFHGYVPYSEVQLNIEKQHILLAPYQLELQISGGSAINTMQYMSPLKIFEYMACKRPIILSRLKVLFEVLDDNSACFADPKDINEWQAKLEKLVNDNIYYNKIIDNSYSKFIKYYTVKYRVELIINFIENAK